MGQGGSTPPKASTPSSSARKTKAKKPKKQKQEEEDEEDRQLRAQQHEADAAALAAQAQAQTELMLFNQQFEEGVDDDEGGMNFDPSATVLEDVELEEEVSLHSDDFRDEQLLQGLRDLDEEMEEEFQQQIAAMKEEVKALQAKALACTRQSPPDKESAKQFLLEAKQKEKEIEAKVAEHEKPLSMQIEELTEKVEAMTETIAQKKQESLASLKAGDKPTALEHLKQAKLLEPQLAELKEKLNRLEEEKAAALRPKE